MSQRVLSLCSSRKVGQPSPESHSTCSWSSDVSLGERVSNVTLARLRVRTGIFQYFLQEEEGMAGGVIWQFPEDLVANRS